jgi:hypothetical protein
MMQKGPYYYQQDFFHQLAALLLAGNIQARVVHNEHTYSIEVKLESGTRVYWTNRGRSWAYTAVLPDGDTRGAIAPAGHPLMSSSVSSEEAAAYIAQFPYVERPEMPEAEDLTEAVEE